MYKPRVLPYNRYIHCCKVMCDVRTTKSRHFNIVFVPSTKNKASTVYCYALVKGACEKNLKISKGCNLTSTDNTMTKRKKTNN